MENQGMEEDTMSLTCPENSATQTSEIAPLQLENHRKSEKSSKDMQDGLKFIITSSVFFAVSVTIALIFTIYLAPPQVPPHAAVVSDSKLCSSTGERLLKRGGSAVDAAIAVVLCEGLVNPHHSGIGGGGFMIIRKSKENTTHVIDFMDEAPAAFVNTKNKIGLQVGVPGMLRGLELAHQKYGKLRWIDVVMAVVEIAYSPVNISSKLGAFIMSNGSTQIQKYFDIIRMPGHPDKMNLTKFGWLLQAVADDGADAFYNNYADEIISMVTDNGGVMTRGDLKGYKAYEREPIRSTFLNMAIDTVPSPGGGPLLLLFLNLMENLTLSEISPNSSDFYHLVVEALKFTYGHLSLMQDSAYVRDNVSSVLISKSYASSLAARVDLDQTHQELNYYSPGPGPEFHPQGTSQISVLGPNDDMVSVTVSLNGLFGSGLVTESGIILNKHMINFITDENYDDSGSHAGKRPFVLMSPTVVYNPNRPCGRRFALGGANGKTLLAGLAQVIINILHEGLPVGAAVDAPRLDVQLSTGQGDEITCEENFSQEIVQMLKMKQHENFQNLTDGIGIVHIVAKINETIYARADFRSGGEAVIY